MLQPISERIAVLDILRGFALFGVLAVNILDFSSPMFMPGYVAPAFSPLESLAQSVILFFATGKFYLLFSFLFGLGFVTQMRRTSKTEQAFVPFYLRRLFILLVIGILHGVLLWHGDILSTYALAGVALLALRHWNNRWLWVLVALSMMISFAFIAASAEFSEWQRATINATEMTRIIQNSSWIQMVQFRVDSADQIALMIVQVPSVFAMFLIGLMVGRSGYLEKRDSLRPMIQRAGGIGLIIGLPANLAFVTGLSIEDPLLTAIGMTLGAPALAVFYGSMILQLAERLGWLAPVGQMALTNYLTHSLVCTTLFYGYGFGLYDRLSPMLTLALVLVIFSLQVIFSRVWLQYFRFGPIEWLWRSLTYGKWQPMIRRSTSTPIQQP
ncbi:MAG: DUF418 domain-containing protein [Anaerolineae bacterium]|nr:DUF418 domain-containing protein [Anaerolineae bacterium]